MSLAIRVEQAKQEVVRSALFDYIEKKRKRVERLSRKTNGNNVTFSGDNTPRLHALETEQHQLSIARLVWAEIT